MDIHNLLNYPAEQVVAYIPNIYDVVDHREKSSNIATEEADEGDDDSQKHSKIIPANAQKILQTLETFWMQQDEDSQEFVCTLQRMRGTRFTRVVSIRRFSRIFATSSVVKRHVDCCHNI